MKKLLIVLAVLMAIPSMAFAIDMIQTDEKTVRWVGNADFARIWVRDIATKVETMVEQIDGGLNAYVLKLDDTSAVYVGVQMVNVATIPNLEKPVEAVAKTAWSDVPADCKDGRDFGLFHIEVNRASSLFSE